MTLIFTFIGAPQGKGRARAARTRFGVRMYTPEKTRSYEQAIRALARAEMGSLNPMSGPVWMMLRAVFEPPASWPEKKKQAALRGEIRPTKKPDLDNVEKAWLDGLNGVAYLDDAQVVEKTSCKVYGPQALVVVSVMPLL